MLQDQKTNRSKRLEKPAQVFRAMNKITKYKYVTAKLHENKMTLVYLAVASASTVECLNKRSVYSIFVMHTHTHTRKTHSAQSERLRVSVSLVSLFAYLLVLL